MLQSLLASYLGLGSVLLVSAQTPYAITGVHVESGPVPLRKNINDLQSEAGPQWDLYIQALLAMHDMDSSDTLSFFQIAGIHGKPFIEWNNTGGGIDDIWGEEWRGYCPHGEPLFVSWHRPYVLLYEQLLVSHAKQIASKYPDDRRDEYIQAAVQLRAPWWDWAEPSEVPPSTVPQSVTINTANGSTELDNPLATFHFPQEALEGKYGDFDSQKRTQIRRCPAPDSYPETANNLMRSHSYKEWVYDVFTNSENFTQFASTSERGISLEQIHNNVHRDGACGGQFLAAEFSGFDPLFMLHHSNIDRLWAYWQAIHPDAASFTKPYPGRSRFSTPSNTNITPDSPLQPFFDQNGQPHTTKTVTSIQQFGYTYQGLEYWEKSDDEMKNAAIRLINELYSDKSDNLERRRNPLKNRYFVHVQLHAEEVERPCLVNIYLADKRVGSVVVMEQPSKGPLNAAFSLDKALHVEGNSSMRTIEQSLNVEIVKIDGSAVQSKSLSSLNLEIEDVEVISTARDHEFPKYGTRTRYPLKINRHRYGNRSSRHLWEAS